MIKAPDIRSRPWLYLLFILAFAFCEWLLLIVFSDHQSAPIWLPAGVALAGCYRWWWRFLPSLFLVSVALKLIYALDSGESGLDIFMLANSVVSALGITLQAGVGAWLLRYRFGSPLEGINDKRVLCFIIHVAGLVSLISAGVTVFADWIFDPGFDPDIWGDNLLHIWLGDVLGVLIATPFFLTVLEGRHSELLSVNRRRMTLLICSVLCIVIVLINLFLIKNSYQNALELADRELRVIEHSLNREILKNQANIQTLARYIQSTPDINREDFSAFVSELMKSQPSIKAMSWNPIVLTQHSSVFEKHLSDIYQRPIEIKGTPIAEGDHQVVVQYISPEAGNEAAIGFNVYSNQKRKSVLNYQNLTYQLAATPIIQLVQSDEVEAGYLIFAPVYALGERDGGEGKGGKQISGYATGVFLAEQIIASALLSSQINIFSYELHEQGSDKVFASNTGSKVQSLTQSPHFNSLSISLSGQTWQVDLVPKNEFLMRHQTDLSLLIHMFELIVVAFSMMLVILANNRQIALHYLVKSRTKELENARREADDANSAKSLFLANMSHEIRNPLNAVIGFSQLAKRTSDDYTRESYIHKILESSKSLLSIINDILDISKIESKKLVLEQAKFDMHALLSRVEMMFKPAVMDSDIHWFVEDRLPKDHWYIGDAVRLEQVLINLCSNAVKFTEKGGVSVVAQLKDPTNIECESAHIQIKVKDTGIGIEQADVARLFDAFTQADVSTTRRFGGTGLGLAISKELCSLMEGEISVTSELGVGTEFTLDIKLAVSHVPVEEESEGDVSQLSGLRILVAEDNEINQMVIYEMLSSLEVDTVVVENGQLAVEAIQRGTFDMILMDCQMPVLDGYNATAQIRELGFLSIPIIALTADVTKDSKNYAEKIGFSDHLSKPIDIKRLAACIMTHRV